MNIKLVENLKVVIKTLLFQIGNDANDDKNIYLRNAIAKSGSLVASIDLLNQHDKKNEGWILFRCLIDRYLQIKFLDRTDQFSTFKEWSFVQGYEYLQNCKSDEEVNKVRKDPRYKFTKEQSRNYFHSKKNSDKYVKPNPKSELKALGLNFLYKMGYDYSSMRVHPMFEDGDEEYHKSLQLDANPYKDFNHEELIPNSIILAALIITECLNQLPFKRDICIDNYLRDIAEGLNSTVSFYKLIKKVTDGHKILKKL